MCVHFAPIWFIHHGLTTQYLGNVRFSEEESKLVVHTFNMLILKHTVEGGQK